MKLLQITPEFSLPVLGVGCMRLKTLNESEASAFLNTALELGLNFFDHADIYGEGFCEELFAKALPRGEDAREKIILQSKCGIRRGFYDFSKAHILNSVENSLKRLHTDYLDILLLHRPDTLCEPEEVAKALDLLKKDGKVRYFGVSNHTARQISLLQTAVQEPLLFNQLQFGPAHAYLVESSLNENRADNASLFRDDGILDFCRINHITIQPWSPFQYAPEKKPFALSGACKTLNETLDRIGEKYSADADAVTIAWLMRHPAKFQPILGTMNQSRLASCAKGTEITLTREEWYEIYRAGNHFLP